MPTLKQLTIVCIISVVVALGVVFALRLLNLEEHATIAAAVSASVAASVAMVQMQHQRRKCKT